MFDSTVRSELEQAAGRTGSADEPLAPFTTLGCGGPAALLLEVDSAERLQVVLSVAARRRVPWFILGRGSNLLVADAGWPGLALRLAGELKSFSIDGNRIDSGGGATLARLAAAAAEAGLAGLEPLALIPGTAGGAVAMNAGAWSASMADVVAAVEVCLPSGRRVLPREELVFSYRRCDLPPDAVVCRVELELAAGDPGAIRAAMKDYQSRRGGAQPVGGRSCGSVFRNPPGASAGELLDRAGCRGMRAGGAEISTVHANFIINHGSATAADVLELMDRGRREVHERFGVVLEPEVKLLGDLSLEPLT
ncbi:MAG: UDP-N-acetylmuramate dehydrogenase [Gaiellales bacterium]|nr:MAG: UDP-N-acetylmuramate dehydrogenase [Gaiellales bacterium]